MQPVQPPAKIYDLLFKYNIYVFSSNYRFILVSYFTFLLGIQPLIQNRQYPGQGSKQVLVG